LKLQIGIDGKSYEVEVEIIEDDAAPRHPAYVPPQASAAAMPTNVALPAAPKQPAGPAEPSNVDESKVCRSPIAGMVVKVAAQPDQTIQTNDLLLVLEAMKMETNVTSPVGGKVKNITVNNGDAVQLNQILVEFE
jgi:methylmalonyl-CoA carboxyltransferase small subunit